MKKKILTLIIVLLSAGCATQQEYNPVTSAIKQTFLLNESTLAQIKQGMDLKQVHNIMGDHIIVGYAYQKAPSLNMAADTSADYKPMTINNPYKTDDLKVQKGDYKIEYYISCIKQPDGVVTDDELIPVIYHEGLVVGKGWDYLKTLR